MPDLIQIQNENDLTIPTGYSYITYNMVVRASTTVTIESGAHLNSWVDLTVNGTLTISGQVTIL